MVKKWWLCPKCMWSPRNEEEHSAICPKCGSECIQKDFIDEKDMKAYLDDLMRENKNKGFRVSKK